MAERLGDRGTRLTALVLEALAGHEAQSPLTTREITVAIGADPGGYRQAEVRRVLDRLASRGDVGKRRFTGCCWWLPFGSGPWTESAPGTWVLGLRWRTDRKFIRSIYAQVGPEPGDYDPLVGVMETELLARAVAELHNAALNGTSA